MQEISPLWKLIYYRKTKNYCQMNNEQLFDWAVHELKQYKKYCKKKKMDEIKSKEKIEKYIDLIFTSCEDFQPPDMFGFERLKYSVDESKIDWDEISVLPKK